MISINGMDMYENSAPVLIGIGVGAWIGVGINTFITGFSMDGITIGLIGSSALVGCISGAAIGAVTDN